MNEESTYSYPNPVSPEVDMQSQFVAPPEFDMQPQYDSQPEVDSELQKANLKAGKKAYSAIGWRLALYGVIVVLMQIVYAIVTNRLFGPTVTDKPWYNWFMIAIPSYVIAFPIFALISMRIPKTQIEKHRMGFGKFLLCALMCAGICGVGSFIGAIINLFFTLPFGVSSEDTNALAMLMLNSNPIFRILTAGILAPIVEEMIFRKFLVDRVVKYGELPAILISGILFGLFHGNFMQAFFAAGLGMFFAFIYARTGKIWYTILLHMIINLSTSVITVFFVSNLDLSKAEQLAKMPTYNTEAEKLSTELMPSVLGLCLWICFLGACVLTGIILFICFRKKFFTKKQECEVARGHRFSLSFCNFGIILFVAFCCFLFINTYVLAIIGS